MANESLDSVGKMVFRSTNLPRNCKEQEFGGLWKNKKVGLGVEYKHFLLPVSALFLELLGSGRQDSLAQGSSKRPMAGLHW